MWLKIIISVLLLVVAYQDFKDRMISAWLFFPLTVLTLWINLVDTGFQTYLLHSVMSLSLLTVYMGILWGYLKFRKMPLNRSLGMGDVIMFAILALSMSVVNFLVFFMFSLLAGIGFYLVKRSTDRVTYKIPLAGIQALGLILAYWTNFLSLDFNKILIDAGI